MNFINKIALLIIAVILASCVDPYQLESNSYEEALVVEATITNELKQQQVKITKTYRLEEAQPSIVTSAEVSVSDDNGNVYTFFTVKWCVFVKRAFPS